MLYGQMGHRLSCPQNMVPTFKNSGGSQSESASAGIENKQGSGSQDPGLTTPEVKS